MSKPRHSAGREKNSTDRKPPRGKALRTVLIVLSAVLIVTVLVGTALYVLVLKKIDNVSALKASEVTDSGLTLSWEPVERANGYRLYVCGEGDSYSELAELTDELSYRVDGLGQCGTYRYAIKAYNRFAESERYTVSAAVRTLPSAVDMISLDSEEAGVITAEWKKCADASGYIAEYRSSGKEEPHRLTIDDPEVCTATVEELEPDTEIAFRVCAYIDDGEIKCGEQGREMKVTVAAPPKPFTGTLSEGIDPDRPMIALTFDDGPLSGDSGDRIVDVLEKNGAKATFFMIGSGAGSHPETVIRRAALGMELGNHTWNHYHYGSDVSAEDISRASDKINEITGQYPSCFRSPGGETTDAILGECEREGMAAYFWSIDTEDWKTRNADSIYSSVMNNVHDGDIILMHEIYDCTADAVERMVPELIAQGYQLVTCYDLVHAKTGAPPQPGREYYSMR